MEKAQKLTNIFLFIISLIAVGAFLKAASSVLVPMVFSVFLVFLLAPIFNIARKLKIPDIITIIFCFVFVIVCGYLLGLIVVSSFQSFIGEFPKYSDKFTVIYHQLLDYVSAKLEINVDVLSGFDWMSAIRSNLVIASGTIVGLFSSTFLVLLYLIFILLERNYFPIKINRIFRGHHRKRIIIIMEHINRDIGKYVRVKTLISVITGLLFWLTLEILKIDFAFVWGVLTVFFNFIPSIGSIVIVVLITLMSLVQFYPDSIGMFFLTGIILTAIQMVMGNLIDPRLQGARLNLSPLLILFSLIIWGWIWGILGMFLAVPMTVAIKIICLNIPRLRSVGILMGTGKEKQKRI
ncbi:MAG: AI-2E family transporter [Spirochaetales bacterium]|nr:AI-2E family transporter [Spirochaetales bacterium]